MRDFGGENRIRKSKIVTFIDFIIFILIGGPILLVRTIYDTYYYTIDLYSDNLMLKNEIEKSLHSVNMSFTDEFDPNFFHFFLLFIKTKLDKNQIWSKRFIKILSDELNICSHMQKVIFFANTKNESNSDV